MDLSEHLISTGIVGLYRLSRGEGWGGVGVTGVVFNQNVQVHPPPSPLDSLYRPTILVETKCSDRVGGGSGWM